MTDPNKLEENQDYKSVDKPTGNPKKDFKTLNSMLMAGFILGNIYLIRDRVSSNLKADQQQHMDDIASSYAHANRQIQEKSQFTPVEVKEQCEQIFQNCASHQKPAEQCALLVKTDLQKFVDENISSNAKKAEGTLASMAMAEGNVDYSMAAKNCVIDATKKINFCLEQQSECLSE